MASAPPATVTQIIDDSPIGAFQRRVFLFCILISVLDGFDTQAIAFVAPAIARDWAISQWHFGFLFSATLLGSVIGSLTCGALADRYGRRRMVIATVAMFGLFSAACALATGYWQLLSFRLLGGIGMGGVIPNMLALTAEYAPARKRATLVSVTLWGFPLGAVLGGIVSGPLIERLGWEAVFWLGAAAPLLLVPALIAWLPESLGFLAVRGERRDHIVALLRRIDPRRADGFVPEARPHAAPRRFPIGALFAPGLSATTILLAAMMFSSLFLTYLLINWVPTMLVQTGMPVSQAILGAVGLNLGGVFGSAFLSRAIDRGGDPRRLLATGYVCGAVAIALAGSVFGGTVAIVLLMACGLFHIGSQLSSSAFITNSYPVETRASGIGFNQAVGRLGSLAGPIAGGALLSAGLTTPQMFRLAVIPALLCAGALIALAVIPARIIRHDKRKESGMSRIGQGGVLLSGEDVTIGAGGLSLPAMLYRPAGVEGQGPAVVLCPGGIGTGLFEIVEWLAASLRDAGILALTLNWRSGSPEHDPDDARIAVDWLIERADVDPGRIGIFGMSRGGNAALRAAALDPRIATVVTFGPVTHLRQQAEGTKLYAPGRHRMLVGWLGDPEDNRAFYEKVEAIGYADRIKQPMLMVHGQHDMHAPPEQSIWMKDAIERAGNGDVRLEIVPGMGHYGDTIPNGYGFDQLRAIILPFVRARL